MDGARRFDHLKTDTAEKPFWVLQSIYLPLKVKKHLTIPLNPKQAWWFCLPHTSLYLCTCQSIIFWMSLTLCLGFLGALHPIPTLLPTGLNLDRLSARPPFAAPSTGLWESPGGETQTNLSLYSLALFQNGPFSSQSISQNSHDLTPPGKAFWSWTLI